MRIRTLATASLVLLLAIPAVTSALSVGDLRTQLEDLLKQIQTTKAALTASAASPLTDDYGTGESGGYCPNLRSTFQRGATDARTGGQVTELQRFLADKYDLDETVAVSGFFGRTTQRYVMQFQGEQGLPTLGIVGSLTRSTIARVCDSSPGVPNPIPVSSNPSASLDQSSLTVSTEKSFALATISGNAANVSVISIALDQADGGAGRANVVVSNGRWSVTFPSVSHGSHSVTVMDADMGPAYSRTLVTGTLIVTDPSASYRPVISSTQAKAANNFEADAGGELSIFGTYLATPDTTHVYFSSTAATVTWSSDSKLVVNVPTTLQPGQTYNLYVVNNYGTSNSVSVKILSVLQQQTFVPHISSTSAKANGNFEVDAGGQVSINGTYLAGNTISSTHVYFGGIEAIVTYASDSVVNANVPTSLTPGQWYDMRIVNDKGSSNTVSIKVLGTVAQVPNPGINSFYAQPGNIQSGRNVGLYWSTTNTAQCGISVVSGGPANIDLSHAVSGLVSGVYTTSVLTSTLYQSTTFELRCAPLTGATGGYAIKDVAVSVQNSLSTCPQNAVGQRGQNGQTYACVCPPNFSLGSVWGGAPASVGYFTDNSDICAAGAMAGQMNSTSGGEVDYTITAGQNSYPGWTGYGVTSQSYGSWAGSFQITGPKG